jgi:pyridinium-3,5-bisthiocarboxylic acid mononucleotide nickel chelatase
MRFCRLTFWPGAAHKALFLPLAPAIYNHNAMRIGYLECFSGISGDMLLGALVDAGVPLVRLSDTAAALGVGARLEARTVMRGGLTATKVDVVTEEDRGQDSGGKEQGAAREQHQHEPTHESGREQHAHEHAHEHGALEHPRGPHEEHHHEHGHAPHRSLSTILKIIAQATIADTVKARARRAFQLLGEAEAAIHSIPIEEVHFHEVGAVDTIVDVVCAAAGCEALGVEYWMASPLNVGSGTVQCAHGTLPVPAPATLALLGDAPVYSAGEPMERVTPTGAAVLRMLDVHYAPLPAMRVQARGYGAGAHDTPGEPNLLRLLVGEESGAALAAVGSDSGAEAIAVIETAIDDSTPQLVAYVSELLLAAGAWDVLTTPVQMKKGRAGVQMTVLARPELAATLRELLLRETTTIGLRWRIENKVALARESVEVSTRWGKVRVKVARWASGKVANAAPEYEDCRAIALGHAIPLKEVMQAALRAYAEAAKDGEP